MDGEQGSADTAEALVTDREARLIALEVLAPYISGDAFFLRL
jgi:hypothetical protein